MSGVIDFGLCPLCNSTYNPGVIFGCCAGEVADSSVGYRSAVRLCIICVALAGGTHRI